VPRQHQQSANEFLAKRRDQAKASYKRLRPQIEAVSELASAVATEIYGQQGIKLLRSFGDTRKSSGEWLKDAYAVAVAHWSKPIEKVTEYISSLLVDSDDEDSKPTKHAFFDLDQSSQASDPIPLHVEGDDLEAIQDGRVEVTHDLASRKVRIESKHIRITCIGDQAFVSLVDLHEAGLTPAAFSGPIRVKIKPSPQELSQMAPGQKPLADVLKTIGYAHLKISERAQ
jgi:hypothetical protein